MGGNTCLVVSAVIGCCACFTVGILAAVGVLIAQNEPSDDFPAYNLSVDLTDHGAATGSSVTAAPSSSAACVLFATEGECNEGGGCKWESTKQTCSANAAGASVTVTTTLTTTSTTTSKRFSEDIFNIYLQYLLGMLTAVVPPPPPPPTALDELRQHPPRRPGST